ncbi:MAG: thiamine phosphate synthase [Candidatus Cloacimonetes bacterium]|nr:thiamine phosphate synthase [Candidatus Cloacimonadota bacterium]
MKKLRKNIGLYFIIDGMYTQDFEKYTQIAIRNKVALIQYRDKDADIRTMIGNAQKMQKLASNSSTQFVVNDVLEVALLSNADGIHVGQSDESYLNVRTQMPEKIIGISTMTLEESIEAEELGADYLGVGPIFATQTKTDTPPPIGLVKLKEIVDKITIPIVAIGGINTQNLREVLDTGVHGVAIISAILTAPDPENEIKKIQEIIEKYNKR